MLVWGWRVPFLVAIVTLVAAILLRYNMPESKKVRQGCRGNTRSRSTTKKVPGA
jgi:predicted MFS family arabinose efflux permease